MQPIPLKQYDQYPVPTGVALGLSPQAGGAFHFKLWSPAAEAVRMMLYEKGTGGDPLNIIALKAAQSGIWETKLNPDAKGKYYTVQVKIAGRWLDETPDPYAKAVGLNGQRGMVLDLADTNPPGWEADRRPPLAAPTDIVLYELHVRDLSAHPQSGIRHRGKFLGLVEAGTRSAEGLPTGLDHLKALGVTHVHLLPAFDFRSIDEGLPFSPERYNWGYDPENYNVPEGSYATDATDGAVRIREFKQMVQALHAAGLRVVMDVVYNHTGATEESVFNRCAPGYYYRQTAEGKWSNASGCGNETASERPMMRQFMLESLAHWVREYHIDGFRFDLMGIHDIETMNQISATLHAIEPSIFLYGEGWTAGGSPLPDAQRAIKHNTPRLDRVAAFSDDFRDALKGSVFERSDRGFVSGKPGTEESIKFGIVAATRHPQLDYERVNYSKAPWAKAPQQTINYAECHDNHTLWDRLAISRPDAPEAERVKMQQLALSMVLTAQGVPFLHAGMEFLRSKQMEENSYQSPDAINQLDWGRKKQHAGTEELVRQLIRMRREHPAFRMATEAEIQQNLRFLEVKGENLVAFALNGQAVGDRWKTIIVVHNGNADTRGIALPSGKWRVALEGGKMAAEGAERQHSSPALAVPGISTMVLFE
jgi:pullulanase